MFSLKLMVGGLCLIDCYRIGRQMTDERAARFGRAAGFIVVLGRLPIRWGHSMRLLTRPKVARAKPKREPIGKSRPRK